MGVDVCANDERNKVEERHPRLVRQESLRKGQCDRRRDPRHPHDWNEPRTHGGTDLVEGAGAGNDGHRDEIDSVLDGGDLYDKKYILLLVVFR